jgi:3-oxoacyl-[acyl-carrier-protein] synthase III
LEPGKSEEYYCEVSNRILRRFGFESRHWAHFPGTARTSLDTGNSESFALECVGALPSSSTLGLQSVLFGSTTSTRYTGSTAAKIAGSLESEATALDLKCGCSTSLASLHTALCHINLGYKRSLVVCSEQLSSVIDPTLRDNLFGLSDGAASLVLEANSENPDFRVQVLVQASRGQFVDLYTTPGTLPPTEIGAAAKAYTLQGDSLKMKQVALAGYKDLLYQLKAEGHLKGVTKVIPHQVNVPMIEELFNSEFESEFKNVTLLTHSAKVGNLGGTGILFSFAKSLQEEAFVAGDRILLIGVGGGLSLGAQIWEKSGI